MLGRKRFRPLGWLVAMGTLGAMAATMVLAAPGGATTATKEYAATFEPNCVIGPGVLNITAKLRASLRAVGPETVAEKESGIEFNEASSAITSPAELTKSFEALSVSEVRGHITRFVLDTTGAEPASLNVAKPSEYPEGLPFFAPVEKEKAVTFNAPALKLGETGRTYSFGPYTITGKAGEDLTSTVDSSAGYVEEAEAGYKATGEGIVSSIEGYSSTGTKKIGPLTVACTAPSGVKVAEIPITAPVTSTTTTTSSTVPPTTTTTTTTTSSTVPPTTTTTTTTSSSESLTVAFENWKLSGSLTDRKLGEAITLPEGCTFNGKATIPGALEGNTACPPFKARVKILGFLPTTIGVNFTESEPVKGTITPGAKSGDLLMKATAKDNIGITSIGLFGLTIPTSCQTSSPVVFPLETEAPSSALVTGASFSGETTLPSVHCQGGLIGSLFGSVLTGLMSGPNNPFSFTIAPQ
jgi:hypothetical protein